MSENSTTPSVYKRGADDGLKLGIIMIVLFIAAAYSLQFAMLGFLAFALTIAVPFVVYYMIKRDYLRYPNMRFFSALWMHGICTFFFGSVLLAAAMSVFLRFIEPTFIIDNLNNAISVYRSLGVAEANEMADAMQSLIDKHMVPSAISFAMTSIWSVVFSGSMLSLLLSLLVRTFNKTDQQQEV
jgi:hypothetical protein